MPSRPRRSSDCWSPADVALVCTTRSRPPAASDGNAKWTPRAAAILARSASMSTRVTSTPGKPREQTRDAAAHHAGTDDGDPVADERSRVPHCVDRGLHGAGQHCACWRHVVGDDDNRTGGHDIPGLVRVQAEDCAALKLCRSALDDAHVEVAVLDRSGKVAVLERRAHRGVLARGDAAAEHERFRAAADRRAQRLDEDVVRARIGQRHRSGFLPRRARGARMRALRRHERHLFPDPE